MVNKHFHPAGAIDIDEVERVGASVEFIRSRPLNRGVSSKSCPDWSVIRTGVLRGRVEHRVLGTQESKIGALLGDF